LAPSALILSSAFSAQTSALTDLYNQRPAWLGDVHKELDAAVAAAYGWPADLPDDEILERLFELNQERAGISRDPGASQRAAVA
jgi:hypothetical protein